MTNVLLMFVMLSLPRKPLSTLSLYCWRPRSRTITTCLSRATQLICWNVSVTGCAVWTILLSIGSSTHQLLLPRICLVIWLDGVAQPAISSQYISNNGLKFQGSDYAIRTCFTIVICISRRTFARITVLYMKACASIFAWIALALSVYNENSN